MAFLHLIFTVAPVSTMQSVQVETLQSLSLVNVTFHFVRVLSKYKVGIAFLLPSGFTALTQVSPLCP